jgi:hypothetical protein
MSKIDIAQIPFPLLLGTLATLESAHEPDDLARAKANLEAWGITFDEGIAELERREDKAQQQTGG